jgi:MFS superfamily sulfate permease-like transporter
MTTPKRTLHLYWLNFRKHDFRASLTVFFVALPLCLGVALASGAPVYSGLMAGIIGGLVVSLFSKSELSVSGPAAGLTAICAAAIGSFEAIDLFYIAVAMAGVLQVVLGVFKLGGFTHFIPSAVIKGMLAAIGILLISKQIPLLIGYEEPDFWQNELFSIITFRHVFSNMQSLVSHTSAGPILVGIFTIVLLGFWKKYMSKKFPVLPTSFVAVLFGSLLAVALKQWAPGVALSAGQYVNVPHDIFSTVHLPDFSLIFQNKDVWQTAIIICFVASLETLLSLEAIDKLDPFNRITPQNREMVAQGVGNMASGLLGGLPITAVIVRSAANAEAGTI